MSLNEVIDEFFEIISNKSPHYERSIFLYKNYFKFEAMLLIYSLPALTKRLNEKGFIITEKTLKTDLFRIRKGLGRESIRKRKLNGEIPRYANTEKIIEIFNTGNN